MKAVFPRVLIGSSKEDKDLSRKGCLFPRTVEGPPAEDFTPLAVGLPSFKNLEVEKMTRNQIYEFFSRFNGPEGCSNRSICLLAALRSQHQEANGSFSWACPGDQSQTLCREILNHMGISERDQKRFLAILEMYEGSCECESLSNILEDEEGVKIFADEFLAAKGNGSFAYGH